MRKDADLIEQKRDLPRTTRPSDRPALRTEDETTSSTDPEALDALWDVAGVAAYLRIPVSSVYKMTARRASLRIPHIRIGGKLRFRRADIEQWLTLLSTSSLTALSTLRQKV